MYRFRVYHFVVGISWYEIKIKVEEARAKGVEDDTADRRAREAREGKKGGKKKGKKEDDNSDDESEDSEQEVEEDGEEEPTRDTRRSSRQVNTSQEQEEPESSPEKQDRSSRKKDKVRIFLHKWAKVRQKLNSLALKLFKW